MKNKLITIAIPTYNMESLLSRCLSSLIIGDSELRHRVEVLIVNDGSKDKSLEIARRYESQYPEMFVVIDKENGNYGSCLNAAIQRATGKYFKTLDADDYYETSEFEKFVDRLSKLTEYPDMILTNGFLDYPETIRIATREEYSNRIHCEPICLKERLFPYNIQRVCFLTSVLEGVTMSTNISYTDVEMLVYSISKISSYFKWLDLKIYHYFLGREGQSVSVKSYSKNSSHIYVILKKYLENIDDKKSQNMMDNEAECLLSLSKMYYKINVLYKATSSEDYSRFKEIDKLIFAKFDILAQKLLDSDLNGLKFIKLWKTNSPIFPMVVPIAKLLESLKLYLIKNKHKYIG